MAYSFKIYDTIDRCPLGDWSHVCRSAGAGIFMDAGFISTVEKAFARNRFWHFIFYDDHAAPVACASACTFKADLVTLANPHLKKAVHIAHSCFSDWAKIKVLFCGLPVSLGQSNLAVKSGADHDQVVRLLDGILARHLARQEKARLIVYKEFDAVACEALNSLTDSGYYRAESPASYLFQAVFKDFSDYCGALNSHYRNDIRRSQRKFERAGLTTTHLRDPAEILCLYDASLHRLYESVLEKSDLKLERVPIEFFHSLTRQFPGQVSLTIVRRESRVVAFNWGLQDRSAFYFIFCGIDYRENANTDLYFNLMYQQLDYALKCGPEHIIVGQTADSFKLRLGCHPRPLYFYVKGGVPLLSGLIRQFGGLLFPKRPAFAKYSIFKRKTGPGSEADLARKKPGGVAMGSS